MNKKINNKNKRINKKKRAGVKSAHKNVAIDNGIDLDEEIIIGMPNSGKKHKKKKKKNKNQGKNINGEPVKKKIEKIDNDFFLDDDENKNKKKKNKKKIKQVKKLTEEQIKRRKKIYKLLKWTGLVVLIIAAILGILLSPLFNIKKIEVVNNQKISQEEIINLSGVKIGSNMFKYTQNGISNRLKEDAYVENVKINRKLPDTIQISIQEREAKLMLNYGNAYVYINNQGYILEISNKSINVPILKGFKTEEKDFVVGKRICNDDLEKLTTVIKIIDIAQSEEIISGIDAIDISDKMDLKILMERNQITAHLGDCSMLEERMLYIKKILEKMTGTPGDIFINMNLNAGEPYFRIKV